MPHSTRYSCPHPSAYNHDGIHYAFPCAPCSLRELSDAKYQIKAHFASHLSKICLEIDNAKHKVDRNPSDTTYKDHLKIMQESHVYAQQARDYRINALERKFDEIKELESVYAKNIKEKRISLSCHGSRRAIVERRSWIFA